jgi:hypothetical protein
MVRRPTDQRKNPPKKASALTERVGVITGAEFEELASNSLGGRGWQRAFVRGTGFAPSTVTRYIQGIYPVPQHVALLLELLATLRRHEIPLPEAFSAEALPSEGEND